MTNEAERLARLQVANARLAADLAGRVVCARDGANLVEVTVDAKGRIVEVAVNEPAARRTDVETLAAAFLRATHNAQENAAELVAARRREIYEAESR